MIEFPEAVTMAALLREAVVGKNVKRVLPPTKEHKFCWYSGEPEEYGKLVEGCRITETEGFGIFVEITFEGGYKLCVNDGVNMRLIKTELVPKNYQLLIELTDGMALLFTVAMYGGIILHNGNYENEYYSKSRQAVSPLSPEFAAYFHTLFEKSKPSLSAKAFLATQQRFPGIGNGVLQDILFEARIHPKRKLETLNEEEKNRLLSGALSVIRKMTEMGGRDTEKDLFGKQGGYQTKMSKNTVGTSCPICGGTIVKEAYLGGSVYYCPVCQTNSV